MIRFAVIAIAAILAINSEAAAERVYRIGFLWLGAAGSDDVSRQGLVEGLRELGYVEGRNLIIEYRYADNQPERLPELAADLVRLNVDVIRTPGTLATRAAQQATTTIPIVTTATDLVSNGFIASLARPGGNVTGVSLSTGPEIVGKRLELLRQAVPHATRIGYLSERGNPGSEADLVHLRRVAEEHGLTVHAVVTSSVGDFADAFEAFAAAGVEAFVVDQGTANRARVLALAERHRLPAIYGRPEFARDGGLMAYGVHLPEVFRRTALSVDRILKGSSPTELPVEQPTRFELLINARTARALGLELPSSLLARADEVIE